MKRIKDEITYFFVDESGDPTFYDTKGHLIVGNEGCSMILILGFIKTSHQEVIKIRKKLYNLRNDIINDEYFKEIPSVKNKTVNIFHAKDDIPEIREKVYKILKTLNFKSNFVVARKIEKIFIQRHKKSENLFYNDMITYLFSGQLHLSKINKIYFAVRGSSTRQALLENAIRTAIYQFESKRNIKIDNKIFIQPQSLSGEPCLQVIDYMNWAVYRAFTKREFRYLNFMWNKIAYLHDIYDFSQKKRANKVYGRYLKLDVNKISPL